MQTLVLSALLLSAALQPNPGWSSVAALPRSTVLRIETNAGTIDGKLLGVSTDHLSLLVDGHTTAINRAGIRSIARRISHRARNAAVGFAVGLGAGLVIYARRCNDSCMAEGASFITAPLSAAGTGLGALWPARGWQTIYRR